MGCPGEIICQAKILRGFSRTDKIKKKGIEIKRKGARSSIQSVDTGSALYMVTVYTYKTPDSFKGQFRIGKDLLIYLPDKGHFEVERVKN